jgi:hypothetical protein
MLIMLIVLKIVFLLLGVLAPGLYAGHAYAKGKLTNAYVFAGIGVVWAIVSGWTL